MASFYKEFEYVLDPKLLEEKFIGLLQSELETVHDIELWLFEQSCLLEEVYETTIGHKIEFYLDTTNQNKKQQMNFDETNIIPLLKKYSNLLDTRLIQHPLHNQLNKDLYGIYIKRKENSILIFQEENIDLEKEINSLLTLYLEKINTIKVLWNDEEKPVFQLQRLLESENRTIREQVWNAIQNAQLSVKEELEEIFQSMFDLRIKLASISGYETYTDYAFHILERFDYNSDYCITLAENIRKYVVPLKRNLDKSNKEKLKLVTYKPWDLSAPISNNQPNYPFTTSHELIEKGINVFKHIDTSLVDMFNHMKQNNYFDMDPREGKSPGAYCLPMLRSKHSFIVMNHTNHFSNIRTFIHEIGHCYHNYVMKDLPLSLYREPTMEIAEFASMTMEYLTLDFWYEFYPNKEDFRLAKKMQLEGFISYLPSGIVVDLFQHWLYAHPTHSILDRNNKFIELSKQFYADSIDYEGFEETLPNRYRQMRHIFETPFYSIEYIIANIAAVEMYRQFKLDKEGTISRFKKALSLGSSVSMTDIYNTAGVSLQISEEQFKDIVMFVQEQLAELNDDVEKVQI